MYPCSVPLLHTASDDVVAELAEVLNRRVALRHLIHLRILDVLEFSTALRLKRCIRGRLNLGGFLHRSPAGCCIESTLLQDCALVNFLNLKAIIEILCVEDPFCVLCQLVSQKSPLLAAMSSTHVVRLVDVRGGTSVECSIVLVKLILLRSLGSVEASLICPEVGVLPHTRANTEALRHSAGRCNLATILERADVIHCIVIQAINIIKGFVSLSELASAWRLIRCVGLSIFQSSGLIHRLPSCIISLHAVESSVVLGKLSS